MNSILRFLEVFALGTWLGGIILLSFAVAPGAFAAIGSRDQAGALVGSVLGHLHLFGMIAGVVYLLAAIGLARSPAALLRPAALLVILMVVLTTVSQSGVTSRMAALRAQMGSVDRTPAESPLRVEFDRLHRMSVRLETGVLIGGLIALFLTAKGN